jgi:hypothetical protein
VQSIEIRLPAADSQTRLTLTDFNRLRWTVGALRLNVELSQRLAARHDGLVIVDSTGLMRPKTPMPPLGSCIVLWDGLNGLMELQHAIPRLERRTDLKYLYVGSFKDLQSDFPPRSEPLFPEAVPPRPAPILVPLWLDVVSKVRAWARPILNSRRSPDAHTRLRGGGCLVFCGLVRPSTAVLDGFFRGTTMSSLRQAMEPLVELNWTADLERTRNRVAGAYAAVAAAKYQGTADLAAVYSLLNLMHRIATLCRLQYVGVPLLVNEFGVHPFFDPYDANAYRQNLFIDFGSTRGNDLIYPRTMDLILQRKACKNLRFLPPDIRMVDFLANTDADGFLALCDSHAEQLQNTLATTLTPMGRI